MGIYSTYYLCRLDIFIREQVQLHSLK
uniref:BLTX693 n=1 Tax=Nephila pilipes TaxID=299642 RepID=A0A076L330_NEPPI|nr:BLTX693 [Nephila pilipes]